MEQATLTKRGLTCIEVFRELEELDLQGIEAVDDDVLHSLSKVLGKLRVLSLWKHLGLTNAGIGRLAQLPALQELYVNQCDNLDDGVIDSLGQCRSLKRLQLRGRNIPKDWKVRLGEMLPAGVKFVD